MLSLALVEVGTWLSLKTKLQFLALALALSRQSLLGYYHWVNCHFDRTLQHKMSCVNESLCRWRMRDEDANDE